MDALIVCGLCLFLWLAPPCSSFSSIRNLDAQGPLRPAGCPEGDSHVPEIAEGNKCWRRAVHLAKLAYKHGVPFCLEHPQRSKAWQLKETLQLMSLPGVSKLRVDWCAFGSETQKPTVLLTSMPWLSSVVKHCPGISADHLHGEPLRGQRAKDAGEYPGEFCRQAAQSFLQWSARAVQ